MARQAGYIEVLTQQQARKFRPETPAHAPVRAPLALKALSTSSARLKTKSRALERADVQRTEFIVTCDIQGTRFRLP
jgi:hypothetical protein